MLKYVEASIQDFHLKKNDGCRNDNDHQRSQIGFARQKDMVKMLLVPESTTIVLRFFEVTGTGFPKSGDWYEYLVQELVIVAHATLAKRM